MPHIIQFNIDIRYLCRMAISKSKPRVACVEFIEFYIIVDREMRTTGLNISYQLGAVDPLNKKRNCLIRLEPK